jgi:hypothetical protein
LARPWLPSCRAWRARRTGRPRRRLGVPRDGRVLLDLVVYSMGSRARAEQPVRYEA